VSDLGNYGVLLAMVAAAWGIVASLIGAIKHRDDFVRSAEGAVLATALAVVISSGALLYALITGDLTIAYVVDYTSKTLPVMYRIGAMWAGQGGSLLLWTLVTAVLAVIIVVRNRTKGYGIAPYAVTAFSILTGIFAGLVAFVSNPFDKMITPVADGQGLNPLLQDPLQIVHPLALYAGYILYTVPFVLVVSALAAGQGAGPWVRVAQRWSLWSWIALTVGIVLGARWAYAELGWGGYWGWDPVENASLLPWLTGTALLHSGLTHWRTGRLRKLGIVLALTTFILSLFGTFLTRSGVISSVHAFGASNLGPIMGTAILVVVIIAAGLAVWRWPSLRTPKSDVRGHGWVGQRSLTTLLITITAAVLWGTMFPLVHRVLQGDQIAVTPGFFRLIVTPLGVAFLVVFALSPFLPGQRIANVRREAIMRGVIGTVVFFGSWAISHWRNPGIALVLTLGVLALITVERKLTLRVTTTWRETPGGGARTLATMRASGAYVAHVGLIILLAAVALNNSFQTQTRVTLTVGQHASAGDFNVHLQSLDVQQLPDRQRFLATLHLLDKNLKPVAQIITEQDVFTTQSDPHAQVGILTGYFRDIYVVLESADTSTKVATVTIFSNPTVIWIWFGGFLLMLGGLLFALPRRRGAPKLPLENMAHTEELVGV
jgi:cytochrome c-type biogenesis protein CcmF